MSASRKSIRSKTKKHVRLTRTAYSCITIVLLSISGYFAIESWSGWNTHQALNVEVENNRVLRNQLEEEKAQLEKKQRDLTNPDYLEFIARGKYQVSRYGEQIFMFPNMAPENSASDADGTQGIEDTYRQHIAQEDGTLADTPSDQTAGR